MAESIVEDKFRELLEVQARRFNDLFDMIASRVDGKDSIDPRHRCINQPTLS